MLVKIVKPALAYADEFWVPRSRQCHDGSYVLFGVVGMQANRRVDLHGTTGARYLECLSRTRGVGAHHHDAIDSCVKGACQRGVEFTIDGAIGRGKKVILKVTVRVGPRAHSSLL